MQLYSFDDFMIHMYVVAVSFRRRLINDILPNRLGNQCLKNNVCPHLPKIKYEYK